VNISLGYSLNQEPVIGTALNILSLCRRSFPYETFSQVLRSSFILDAREHRAARSLLDQELRKRVAAETSLNGLLASMSSEPLPEFQRLLYGLSVLRQEWNNRASTQTWVTRLQECLNLFGLFNDDGRAKTSYQHQVMQSLDEVWFEFSGLELVKPGFTLEQAITIFTQMVNNKIFQAGAGELPVQILGTLEASGLQFSSLWIMGMTEQNWPPSIGPNPFIPLRLQRQLDMPHCSPQHEYEYAHQQTERILQSANDIVFSYPLMQGEEAFVPSPLVADYPSLKRPGVAEFMRELPAMESLLDDQGPAVETDSYHAGSAALKDQSQCPFRAFVVHRLQSRPAEEPQPGNDPRLRGQLVHKVMELLWQELKTAARLHALSAEQLQSLVEDMITQVLKAQWTGGNRNYEAKRLFSLVMEWLQQEKLREPFTVVSTEQETNTEIHQLKLRLFIDRIDELVDGSRCIVDYKTGEASANAWLGDRPDEPQLPLYALVQDGEVNAVAFANIRAGESRFVGVSKDCSLTGTATQLQKDIRQIPVSSGSSSLKRYDSWEGMISEWQQAINDLAITHVQGHAQVDPKDVKITCRYCDVMSVCRLFDWQEQEEEH
jgi:probable DNA repair protein